MTSSVAIDALKGEDILKVEISEQKVLERNKDIDSRQNRKMVQNGRGNGDHEHEYELATRNWLQQVGKHFSIEK